MVTKASSCVTLV